MTLAKASEAFLGDVRARRLSESAEGGYRALFATLRAFAESQGVVSLSALDEELLRKWRESWTYSSATHRLRLCQLKTFFRFAVESGWLPQSPAARLKPPRDTSPPTMPLESEEVLALIEAAATRARERALILLMRYSGLAIQDAATLATSAVVDRDLTLRRAKTGELVLCRLPDVVAQALARAHTPGRRHYFWTGQSKPTSAAKYWRKRLGHVAATAGLQGFAPHRLRDTFAVQLLLAGVSMEDVSTLLGHSSIKTTERHYAPWDRSRRDRLAAILEDVHGRDPMLQKLRESVH